MSVGNLIEGIVATSAVGALQQIIPQGQIGSITVQATFEERHHNTLTITQHPVQDGAAITDHSYMEPVEIVMKCGWSNSGSAALLGAVSNVLSTLIDGSSAQSANDFVTGIFSQLRRLQSQGQTFKVITSILSYDNMLLTDLMLERDNKTSNALMITATMKQIIIVSTSSSTLPNQSNMASPEQTAQTTQGGTASAQPVDASSLPNNGALPVAGWS